MNRRLKIALYVSFIGLIVAAIAISAYLHTDSPIICNAEDCEILWIDIGAGETVKSWSPVTEDDHRIEQEILAFLASSRQTHTLRNDLFSLPKAIDRSPVYLDMSDRQSVCIMLRVKGADIGVLISNDNTAGDGYYNRTYYAGHRLWPLSLLDFEGDLTDPASIRTFTVDILENSAL